MFPVFPGQGLAVLGGHEARLRQRFESLRHRSKRFPNGTGTTLLVREARSCNLPGRESPRKVPVALSIDVAARLHGAAQCSGVKMNLVARPGHALLVSPPKPRVGTFDLNCQGNCGRQSGPFHDCTARSWSGRRCRVFRSWLASLPRTFSRKASTPVAGGRLGPVPPPLRGLPPRVTGSRA